MELSTEYGFRNSENLYYDDSNYKCGRLIRPLLSNKIIVLLWLTFLLSAVVFLPLNIILLKRNMKEDLHEVTTILRVICWINATLDMMIYFFTLLLLTLDVLNDDRFSDKYITIRNLGALLLGFSIVLVCLGLHGIRTKQSTYVKILIVIQYLFLGLAVIGIFLISLTMTVYSGTVFCLLIGTLSTITITAVFVFRIGYNVGLHTIFLVHEPKFGRNVVSASESQYYVSEERKVTFENVT